MREIKFRAWHNDQMSKPFTLGEAVCWPDGKVSTANRVGIVMQFTGLLDRNGVEIYEGDIIHYMPDLFDSIHVVEPSLRTTARMIIKKRSYWPPQYLDAMQSVDVEVIGNIHQNPELLEGKA